MAGPSGSSSTLVITLGIFLKMLGFFVVLVSYSTLEPIKSREAQYSLQDRFGINLSLPIERGGLGPQSPLIVQQTGRSYDILRQALMTEMDFLGTENIATKQTLRLSVPADIALGINGALPKSPDFATHVINVLKKQPIDKMVYRITIIGQNGDRAAMLRALGDFVQKLVAADYPTQLLTIGYELDPQSKGPQLVIDVKAVPA